MLEGEEILEPTRQRDVVSLARLFPEDGHNPFRKIGLFPRKREDFPLLQPDIIPSMEQTMLYCQNGWIEAIHNTTIQDTNNFASEREIRERVLQRRGKEPSHDKWLENMALDTTNDK